MQEHHGLQRQGDDEHAQEVFATRTAGRSQVHLAAGKADLAHPQAYGGGSATSNHTRSAAAYLSGANAKSGTHAYLGITVREVPVTPLRLFSALDR